MRRGRKGAQAAERGHAHHAHTHISPRHTQKQREIKWMLTNRASQGPSTGQAQPRSPRCAGVPGQQPLCQAPAAHRKNDGAVPAAGTRRFPLSPARLAPAEPHPTCRSFWAGRASSGCGVSQQHVRGSHEQSRSCISVTWISSLSFKFFRDSYFSKMRF